MPFIPTFSAYMYLRLRRNECEVVLSIIIMVEAGKMWAGYLQEVLSFRYLTPVSD
jgi:hypothetical protein